MKRMQSISNIQEYLHVLFSFNVLRSYNINVDESLAKFKDYLLKDARNECVFYRGQEARYQSITCSLSRDKGFIANETSMYDETKNTRKKDFVEFNSQLEYLSKMQHYGMPTRLVDFTYNPLVALFFAVQNTNSTDDAIVYVYANVGLEYSDRDVQILALLPSLKSRKLSAIKSHVDESLSINISEQDLQSIIHSTRFVKYSDHFMSSNPRLSSQNGMFAICGNVVENSQVSNRICSIETPKTIEIRIPYSFKETIKNQLDTTFGINESQIYPELTSWSDYIRQKYASNTFKPNKSYSILRTNDISKPGIKRIELYFVLNRKILEAEAKVCIVDGLTTFKKKYNVIWFYVAADGMSYSLGNWAYTGQWIASGVSEMYSKYPLYRNDENGLFWDPSAYFSEDSRNAKDELIMDGEELFLIYHHTFTTLLPIFHHIEMAYEILTLDDFCIEVRKHTHCIREFCKKMSGFGLTSNSDFSSFLYNYIDFVIYLADLTYWIKLEDTPENWLSYRIKGALKGIRNAISSIDLEKKVWISHYHIKKNSLQESEYERLAKPKLSRLFHEQTIPVSKDAIAVEFNLTYSIEGRNLKINAVTNLYNYARLSLFLSIKNGSFLWNGDVLIENGIFSIDIDYDITGYRDYSIELSLYYPRKQMIEFVNLAGQEYEYLTGRWVNHAGIDSGLHYTNYISVQDGEIIVTEYDFDFK